MTSPSPALPEGNLFRTDVTLTNYGNMHITLVWRGRFFEGASPSVGAYEVGAMGVCGGGNLFPYRGHVRSDETIERVLRFWMKQEPARPFEGKLETNKDGRLLYSYRIPFDRLDELKKVWPWAESREKLEVTIAGIKEAAAGTLPVSAYDEVLRTHRLAGKPWHAMAYGAWEESVLQRIGEMLNGEKFRAEMATPTPEAAARNAAAAARRPKSRIVSALTGWGWLNAA